MNNFRRMVRVFVIFVVITLISAASFTSVSAQERCHANVTKVAGSCVYNGSLSIWQVKISLYGYKVVFQEDPVNLIFENSASNNKDFFTYLSEGSHTYDKYEWIGGAWVSKGTGTISLTGCALPHASASVSLGVCTPGAPGTPSSSQVIITPNNAIVTIAGNDYDASTTLSLSPGQYPFSWIAKSGYWGTGTGIIVVDDCTPKFDADVLFNIGSCVYEQGLFQRDVAITIDGASVTLTRTDAPGAYGPFTSSTTIVIPCGTYSYAWQAVAPGYEGSGSGTLVLPECDPSSASARAQIGSCTYSEGQSLTEVTIWVEHASFTLAGSTYTETTVLKLSPGDHPYSWGPVSSEYSGSGQGVLTVEACDPKIVVDPKPDSAAGGTAPTLLGTLPMLVILGSGLVSIAYWAHRKSNARKQ